MRRRKGWDRAQRIRLRSEPGESMGHHGVAGLALLGGRHRAVRIAVPVTVQLILKEVKDDGADKEWSSGAPSRRA